jgi:hypothetical protein
MMKCNKEGKEEIWSVLSATLPQQAAQAWSHWRPLGAGEEAWQKFFCQEVGKLVYLYISFHGHWLMALLLLGVGETLIL